MVVFWKGNSRVGTADVEVGSIEISMTPSLSNIDHPVLTMPYHMY